MAREHRKEKRRKKDGEEKEVDGQIDGDVVEESNQDRGNLISYCSLDYQRFFDMARFRIHRIHRKLKEELEDKCAVFQDTQQQLPLQLFFEARLRYVETKLSNRKTKVALSSIEITAALGLKFSNAVSTHILSPAVAVQMLVGAN